MALTSASGSQLGRVPAVGVLLANLGTPEAPTATALRPYLRQFLSDPRVIELPAWKWRPILEAFVLTRRPAASAELYRKVWTEEGSPLLVISERQRQAVAAALGEAMGNPHHVALGMRYGRPSIGEALRDLRDRGCRRILVFPLYPQYASASTGSTFDAVADELKTWRGVPELRTIFGYHAEPGYIEALADSIREFWAERGGRRPAKLLFSYHGIPKHHVDSGDPYQAFCHETTRGVVERLGLSRDAWEISFQSRFGREEWLKPYTDVTIEAMARAGVATLDTISPAFSADCLETLEELDGLNREIWEKGGGAHDGYRYIPCLNDRPDHVRLLADLVLRNLQGWVEPPGAWDEAAARRDAEAARLGAEELAGAEADAGYGRRRD